MTIFRLLVLMGTTFMLMSCGASRQFPAVPEGVDESTVPRQTLAVTAEHFHFTPETIRVKQGTLLTLQITATDGTHGFNLGAFGIDETIPEHETRAVKIFAAKKGEYGFKCSHFCGIGHFGMTGKLIVE